MRRNAGGYGRTEVGSHVEGVGGAELRALLMHKHSRCFVIEPLIWARKGRRRLRHQWHQGRGIKEMFQNAQRLLALVAHYRPCFAGTKKLPEAMPPVAPRLDPMGGKEISSREQLTFSVT